MLDGGVGGMLDGGVSDGTRHIIICLVACLMSDETHLNT